MRKLAAGAAVCAALAGAWFFLPSSGLPLPAATRPAAAPSAAVELPVLQRRAPAASILVEWSAQDREFLAGVRDRFGPHIGRKHAQVKAIEQIVAYLMAQYPDDWRDRVAAFLTELFPGLADALIAKFEALMQYNDWLRHERADLDRMPAKERRELLWQARRALFGADAEEIWAGELRNARIVDALDALEESKQLTTRDKFATYLDAVRATYGEESEIFIASRQTELMNRFLDVGAVQDDLRAMAPMERAVTLRQMRTDLGMDEAALTRWDELDRQRDTAWSAGEQYMAGRQAILAQYDGAEEAERLRALQDQLLGEEAETIRSEEAAGFYRYAHPRRIGRE